ncbi:Inner membrane protein YiaV precursor [Shimia sp. SK013]|uniref:HlyD family secretion protein n=1 Tax=Shimia sp. SK013 TaxID=1389006 RepID=UPI0006B4251A|nr:biotin/lipoyl-binding protein [Shimia sp. SK013]KPA22792.1 Inner membrane protein YiaV precursor [Shimia sp. SK013]
MLELIFSALVTILPDYLYRRYRQGKRMGHEITLFNVWYELRWGLTSCGVLAIALITVIFHFHPTAITVQSPFRTVSVLSERAGRVAEVYVTNNAAVAEGDALFRLDTSRQEAAAETARRSIAEVDAALLLGQSEIAAARGQFDTAGAVLAQAEDDLARRTEIAERNNTVVSEQELQRLERAVLQATGARDAALATWDAARTRVNDVLPAQRQRALAQLAEAETEIQLSTVYAEVAGTVTQFLLKPGDLVNPILRPAGILVPDVTGQGRFVASFKQISAPVLVQGMLVEIACASKPMEVIPMVIAERQGVIAGGQFRPGDTLVDSLDRRRPGTVTVFLEPVFKGHTDGVLPGSQCVGVAYSNRGMAIEAGDIQGFGGVVASVVDGMGIANAIIMRAQAVLLPVKALVFS